MFIGIENIIKQSSKMPNWKSPGRMAFRVIGLRTLPIFMNELLSRQTRSWWRMIAHRHGWHMFVLYSVRKIQEKVMQQKLLSSHMSPNNVKAVNRNDSWREVWLSWARETLARRTRCRGGSRGTKDQLLISLIRLYWRLYWKIARKGIQIYLWPG